MEDAKPQADTKDIGSSIKCPMLSSTNYMVWALRMKMALRVHKVWETIEPGLDDEDKNVMAMALLCQSIPENLVLQVGELDTAKEVWDAIKTRNLGAERVKIARLQTLKSEFDRLTMMENETIDEFAGKLSIVATKSAALGQVMDESALVKKFLSSLPRSKFIHIVASLEQVLDLEKTGFEDIVGRLKAYEERIGGETQSHGQDKLLFSNSDTRNSQGGGRGSRGGGRAGRGRGKGKEKNQDTTNQQKNKGKKDLSKVICWRCDKAGHFASNCPDKNQRQETNLVETQEADVALYTHEIVFLNEDNLVPKKFETEEGVNNIWYLDNGASNHMTGNREFFSEIDQNVTGKVRFGDGSCVDIGGKGSIMFKGKTGETRILSGIYYIPDLKHNILRLGLVTEHGCVVSMKGDYLMLYDPAGRLLMKVTRTPNRLYKVVLEIGGNKCLQSQVGDESKKWHARLGHLSVGAMSNMVKKDMVVGMPYVEKGQSLCDSCLAGKQTRKSFPTASPYRAKHNLELIHGDLCGPMTPKTPSGNQYVFVIIDDHSRYMWTILLKEKSEAFDRFKSFKTMVEKQTGMVIKTLRTDRGGEFTSANFQSFCEEHGITRQLTAPYTPQQNGVVERRNRTLMEMTRSILKGMNVPNFMWGEAIRHSTYLINRVPTKAVVDKTPYELFHQKRPNIEHLRIFGCIAYAKETIHL